MISSTPIFAASDIVQTLAYYKEVLGFDSQWTWGEPASFGGASMGGVSIMFSLQPELAARIHGHQHWIKVDDADTLHARHRASGARIVEEIGDRPWGSREYVVEDLNGYHLRFAGPPSSDAGSSDPFPEGVTLERRKPTRAEFVRVTGAAFGDGNDQFERERANALERCCAGVVATSPDGEAIGVLRIVHDAPGWFSIWDVAVVPAWQARHIGARMMEEAIGTVHDVSPGAFVFLFTFKHGFYERLGFTRETVSMRKV